MRRRHPGAGLEGQEVDAAATAEHKHDRRNILFGWFKKKKEPFNTDPFMGDTVVFDPTIKEGIRMIRGNRGKNRPPRAWYHGEK